MALLPLAPKTLRHRKAAFAGAFVTLLCAAALVTACGMLLETGLRGRVAPERYAGAPVHDQAGPTVVGAEVVHPHDVGVTEPACRLRLHTEPLVTGCLVAVQDLHRDGPAEDLVGSSPHLTHGAAPE